MSTSANRHEVKARNAKAVRLATVLVLTGASVADLADRTAAEAAAGTRPASDTTWALVTELVRAA